MERCTACGSDDTIILAYGYPSGRMFERAARGEIELGGCFWGPGAPTHRCRSCDTRFTPSTEETHEQK